MATCPHGHNNPDGQRYCGQCGALLSGSDTAAPAPGSSAPAERSAGATATLAEKIDVERGAGPSTATEPVATKRVPAERVTKRVAVCILTVLSAQFLAFGIVEAWNDSPTFDEGYHLAGGLTALTRHQLRLTPEHGVLPKVLGALPALAASPVIPNGKSWRQGDGNAFYKEFLDAQDFTGDLQTVMFLARLVSLAEAIALGWALYALAGGLFGRPAGVVAGAAWLTTPLVLAFGHIDGSDLPFALAVVVACIALRHWLQGPTVKRLVLVGLAGSALLLTRFTGLAVVPALALVVGGSGTGASWKRRVGNAFSVLAVSWAGVWVVIRALSPLPRFHYVAAAGLVRETSLTRWARAVPWPKEYAAGILESGRLANSSGQTFLLGRHGVGARWLYWPGAMLVKLPTSALILAVAAGGFWLVSTRVVRMRAVYAIVAPLAALIAVTVPYKRPSLRYFLPGIALLFVLGAPVLAAALRRKAGRAALIVLAVVQLVSFWTAVPHSLAWTAPPFRPGYQYIADTNDWGQDLYSLQHWAKGKRPRVAYFGFPTSVPGQRPLFVKNPRNIRGWVAVSTSIVNYDYLLPRAYTWLKAYCPVGKVGGSILVYDFNEPPNTSPGPRVAVGPCHSRYSHR